MEQDWFKNSFMTCAVSLRVQCSNAKIWKITNSKSYQKELRLWKIVLNWFQFSDLDEKWCNLLMLVWAFCQYQKICQISRYLVFIKIWNGDLQILKQMTFQCATLLPKLSIFFSYREMTTFELSYFLKTRFLRVNFNEIWPKIKLAIS